MCGRFTLRANADVLVEEFGLDEKPEELAPRYNIAPSQPVTIVPNRVPRKIGLAKWGFIPFWAKDASIGNREINARAETVATKGSYRESFARRRCLIPADGFYEWQGEGSARRPVYIRMEGDRVFAFAGLWSVWRNPAGERIVSCAIVTTEPNELLAPIHDRMPVILPREAYELWLEKDDAHLDDVKRLLVPLRSDRMRTHEVSRYVNTPANEGPECIEPVPANLDP